MTDNSLYKLRFPIGEFTKPNKIKADEIEQWIMTIEALPEQLQKITKDLSEHELNYKYRPEGWTIKQVVHHCADSHINSLMRFKLALTEDTPVIRPYFEDKFANLIDYNEPINASLLILIGVHKKLSLILRNLTKAELQLQFEHPEHGKRFSLEETIGIYAWHSAHHLAHIKQALHFKDEFK